MFSLAICNLILFYIVAKKIFLMTKKHHPKKGEIADKKGMNADSLIPCDEI